MFNFLTCEPAQTRSSTAPEMQATPLDLNRQHAGGDEGGDPRRRPTTHDIACSSSIASRYDCTP
eukprot:1692343-Pyramimonas_sp.AAC.1